MELFATLGPACSHINTLKAMLDRGMTGMRLNLSHGSLQEAEPLLSAFHQAAEERGVHPKLIMDMQGPELRIASLTMPLTLKAGERVLLRDIPFPSCVLPYLNRGQSILLDDGKLQLACVSKTEARVLTGGVLHSRKSVALPGCVLKLPVLTETDKENLSLAQAYGVTGIMQPFVRGGEDLWELRCFLKDISLEGLRVYAKIENQTGMERLPEIIEGCDEIVIARGDLGQAMPLWQLPAAQKNIAKQCRERGRAFTVATQLLSSMEHSPVPTRAELLDIFNAVLDGASSLILTGETAAGKYPVEAMSYLSAVAREAVSYREHSTLS